MAEKVTEFDLVRKLTIPVAAEAEIWVDRFKRVAILTAVSVSESYNLSKICIFNPRPIVD